ncbi:MAG: hypothetical protein WCG87_07880 [Bacteroidota bacterium]
MKRFKYILILACAALAITSCKKNGDSSTKGCTNFRSFNYNPSATTDDGSCQNMQGCLDYIYYQQYSGSTSNTFKDTAIDNMFFGEVATQRSFFNMVSTGTLVRVLYEPSADLKNAYAVVKDSVGTILFGYNMFMYTTQKYGNLPYIGVLAHEFAHRLQQTLGWLEASRPDHNELEADAYAGYYMSYIKQWPWSQVQSYYTDVYAASTYNFNDPVFHGTLDQRLKAAQLGVNSGSDALLRGVTVSLDSLHHLFSGKIRTQIAP